jgi:hypothetical protein
MKLWNCVSVISSNADSFLFFLKNIDFLINVLLHHLGFIGDQFVLFRVTISDELISLPNEANEWIAQVTQALLQPSFTCSTIRDQSS